MFMELVQIVHVLGVYIVVCSAGRYTGSHRIWVFIFLFVCTQQTHRLDIV